MKLLADWRQLLRRAWSVRLALLAAVLGAVDIGVQFLAATRPDPWIAMGAALCSLASAVARIVAQPKSFEHD
jgi:peptidoglycan/LPS O-acetylase OafA/YrhL